MERKKHPKYYACDSWDIMNRVFMVYDEKVRAYERGEGELSSIEAELEDAGLTYDIMVQRLYIYDPKTGRKRHRTENDLPMKFELNDMLRYARFTGIPIFDFLRHNAVINALRGRNKEGGYMLKQQEIGKRWEELIISAYAKRGYFAYKVPTMNSGTVFDILVAKKGGVLMIEAKHIDEEKLWYEKSGIKKKRDELDHFVNTTQNNVYIYVDSEKTGRWWTTWVKAKPIFEERGYITKQDCAPLTLDSVEWEDNNE